MLTPYCCAKWSAKAFVASVHTPPQPSMIRVLPFNWAAVSGPPVLAVGVLELEPEPPHAASVSAPSSAAANLALVNIVLPSLLRKYVVDGRQTTSYLAPSPGCFAPTRAARLPKTSIPSPMS